MPRIAPALLRRAYSIHPYLASLLPVCRDLESAGNELRWLKNHARNACHASESHRYEDILRQHVERRGRAEPLQYILGTEYFGELEIKCRPGVLIPRRDTETAISHLVGLLAQFGKDHALPERLRVLDLCTGTGCIPLLFHDEFYRTATLSDIQLDIFAVDLSANAVSLARENHRLQINDQSAYRAARSPRTRALKTMVILKADVLHEGHGPSNRGQLSVSETLKAQRMVGDPLEVDILISNPPYISAKAFGTTTARSVRRFEPKLALVPEQAGGSNDGDLFYPHLLRHARQLNAKIVLFEVADMDQAKRVASLLLQDDLWDTVEIWKDDPMENPLDPEYINIDGVTIQAIGAGNGRSVFAYCGTGSRWLRYRQA